MIKDFISTLIIIHVCQGGRFISGTVTVPLKDCSEGMVSDGKGGCMYKTTILPETTMIKTTYHYDDECKKVFGHRFRRCKGTTSTPTTTEIITSTISFTYTCPGDWISDGYGCYDKYGCNYIRVNGRRFRRCSIIITPLRTIITTTFTTIITTTPSTTEILITTSITNLETTRIVIDCFPGFTLNNRGDNCDFLGCDYYNQMTAWNGWYDEYFFDSIHERYGCTTTTLITTMIITSTTITSIPYTCPWYSISDGHGGCYGIDSCDDYFVLGRRFRRCSIQLTTLRKIITTTFTTIITTTPSTTEILITTSKIKL